MVFSHFVILILVVLISNLDIFLVGISYGTKKIKIPFTSNFLIGIITGLGTMGSIYSGKLFSSFLSPSLRVKIGGLIILGVGLWLLRSERKKENIETQFNSKTADFSMVIPKSSFITKIKRILDNPFVADMDFSGNISLKEAFLLGWAMALNNMANGLGIGISGVSPILAGITTMSISIFAIWLGMKFGLRKRNKRMGKVSGIMAGVLLCLIGIYEMLI